MIDLLGTQFQNGYAYIRNHPQLLVTILLVIIIPFAFLLSGQQFLSATRDNQEQLERERIGMLHDVFVSLMHATNFDQTTIQSEIIRIADQNPDLTEFLVAQETSQGILVVASLDTERIGTIVTNAPYRMSHVNPEESLILPYAKDGIRYWKSYKLVTNSEGNEFYLVTETSLEHIDALFSSRIMYAYYWLAAILIIVLFLVIRHVKLIDYAYLYKETRKANEMKDLFTNMIAHELRAPLTAMRGYASMIHEDSGSNNAIQTYATRIERSAERLVFIVNDLLDVARIQSGKLTMQADRTNVQKIISSVLEGMESSAKAKKITLTNEGFKNDVFITVDEKRLFQALTNLVSNAIKYTNSGEIKVHTEDRNDRIEIRVMDTGMGISATDQKNLFAPFFRVENSEMEQITGTGLGMWITKQLIELMKGSVAVESIKGVGTHIVVTLPK